MKNYKGQGMCNWFDYKNKKNEEKDNTRTVKRHDVNGGISVLFFSCSRNF
jgi:hypothetical protein